MIRNLLWFAGSGSAFYLFYRLGLNRNLFFLMFSMSCVAVAIALVDASSLRIAILAASLALASVSVSAPLPKRVNVHNGHANGILDVQQGQRLGMVFALTDIDKRRAECGEMKPLLNIVGTNLAALDVEVNSPPLETKILKNASQELKQVSLPADLPGLLAVVLVAKEKIGLFQGPEVFGRTSYPDAVYLKFENPKCSVVYHTRIQAGR